MKCVAIYSGDLNEYVNSPVLPTHTIELDIIGAVNYQFVGGSSLGLIILHL